LIGAIFGLLVWAGLLVYEITRDQLKS
jgi:hypothetical protein